jgi:putative transposase
LPRRSSTARDHVAKRVDPEKLSARGKRDSPLRREIERVFAEKVYGARKVWRQMLREGFGVALCTVERLMADLGPSRRHPRQADPFGSSGQGGSMPTRPH